MNIQKARLVRTEILSPSIFRYVFSYTGLHTILPGQHIEILLSNEWKPYSVARHHQNIFEIIVKMVEDGTASKALKSLKPNDKIEVKFNDRIHDQLDKPGVMIGIGTGVVPLYSIVRHMLDSGMQFPVLFLYGAHAKVDLVYEEKLQDLREQYSNLTIKIVSSDDANVENPDKRSTSERIYNEVVSMKDRKIFISARTDIEEDLSHKLLASGILAKNLYTL